MSEQLALEALSTGFPPRQFNALEQCYGGVRTAYKVADQSLATSSTALQSVTDLIIRNVEPNKAYRFEAVIYTVVASATGGLKMDLSQSTLTVANMAAFAEFWDLSLTLASTVTPGSNAIITALNTAIDVGALTVDWLKIYGTFECKTAGDFAFKAAQHASNNSATTIKRGSFLKLEPLYAENVITYT